ncbi:MAG: hypothetical protein V3V53_03215 [Bacteroidales bacterium]|nr:hypothetical protein [Bacteroidales bacterium]
MTQAILASGISISKMTILSGMDLTWVEGKPVSEVLNAQRNTSFQLRFRDNSWEMELKADQEQIWIMH